MKILLVIDQPNWIFHDIAKNIARLMPEHNFEIIFGHKTSKEEYLSKRSDIQHFIDWHFINIWDVYPRVGIMNVCSWRNWDGLFNIQEAIKRCKRVVAVSKLLCKELKAEYIPDGLDKNLFSIHKVGFVGRKDNYKGYQLVVDATNKAGMELSVADCQKDKMPDFYRGVDVVVCASEREGYGTVIAEALAMGKPIITTAEGDFKKEPIIKVDRGVEEITRALVQLKNRYINRSWDIISKKYKELYENIISSR